MRRLAVSVPVVVLCALSLAPTPARAGDAGRERSRDTDVRSRPLREVCLSSILGQVANDIDA